MDNSAIAQVLSRFGDRKQPIGSETRLPFFTAGTTDPHVAALAMPVFGTEGRLIGALALSRPISRLTAEQAGHLGPQLRDAAERLSSELGAQL